MEIQTSPLGRLVIGAAIEVHSHLGPGLLESTYEHCLAHEMTLRGLTFERQVALPVIYKGTRLDGGYRVDFVVDRQLVVELKAIDRLLPVHEAQVITYLRLLRVRQGLLINFNARLLTAGLRSLLLDRP